MKLLVLFLWMFESDEIKVHGLTFETRPCFLAHINLFDLKVKILKTKCNFNSANSQ